MQERQKQILGEIISNSPGYTIAQLASFTQASEKTVRSDIKTLNEYLKPYGAYIQQNGRQFFISLHHKQAAINAYTKISKQDYQQQLLTTPEDRKIKLLFFLLDHPDYHSMEALAEETFVSKATIFFHIHELETLLSAYPNIKMEISTHTGIRLLGDEEAKRNLIVHIFHQRISRSIANKFMHAYLCEDIYKQIIPLSKIVSNCMETIQIPYTFDEYYTLLSALFVTLHRHAHGFSNCCVKSEISPFLRSVQRYIQEETSFSLSDKECNYLAQFEKRNPSLHIPQEQPELPNALHTFLAKIQEQYHLHNDAFSQHQLFAQCRYLIELSNTSTYLSEDDIYQIQKNYLCSWDMSKYLSILLEKNNTSITERCYFTLYLETCVMQTPLLKKRILIYESNTSISELLYAKVHGRFGGQAEVYICSGSLIEANTMIQDKSIDFLLTTKSIVSNFSGIPVIKISRILKEEDEHTILHYLLHTNPIISYQESDANICKEDEMYVYITMYHQTYACSLKQIFTHKNIAFYAQSAPLSSYIFTSLLWHRKTLYVFLYPQNESFANIYASFTTIAHMLFLE